MRAISQAGSTDLPSSVMTASSIFPSFRNSGSSSRRMYETIPASRPFVTRAFLSSFTAGRSALTKIFLASSMPRPPQAFPARRFSSEQSSVRNLAASSAL